MWFVFWAVWASRVVLKDVWIGVVGCGGIIMHRLREGRHDTHAGIRVKEDGEGDHQAPLGKALFGKDAGKLAIERGVLGWLIINP